MGILDIKNNRKRKAEAEDASVRQEPKIYVEPADYFPWWIRLRYGLGEFYRGNRPSNDKFIKKMADYVETLPIGTKTTMRAVLIELEPYNEEDLDRVRQDLYDFYVIVNKRRKKRVEWLDEYEFDLEIDLNQFFIIMEK